MLLSCHKGRACFLCSHSAYHCNGADLNFDPQIGHLYPPSITVVLTCVFWPSGRTALYPPPSLPLTICCNSISGTSPRHLSDLRQPSTPTRRLWSASDTGVNTKTFGERSFSYAGPSVSNSLPQALCHSDSLSSFKDALKTHLFNNYF